MLPSRPPFRSGRATAFAAALLSTAVLTAGDASAQSWQAGARGQPQVVYSLAPRQLVRSGRGDLGGGFIEFLFSGGQMAEAPMPAPQPRRMRAQPAYMPDQMPPGVGLGRPRLAYALPPSAVPAPPAIASDPVLPAHQPIASQFERQTVAYEGPQAPGTIVIDTSKRFLYLVQAGGKAVRYGVGVGREGFEWSGSNTISRKAEWPDWRPPKEMLARRPDLPTFMAGGPRNPLGARAMYLGSTLYRIHGSNEPQTIGHAVSSGCIRMRNEDVIDLYDRVTVGTKVVVL